MKEEKKAVNFFRVINPCAFLQERKQSMIVQGKMLANKTEFTNKRAAKKAYCQFVLLRYFLYVLLFLILLCEKKLCCSTQYILCPLFMASVIICLRWCSTWCHLILLIILIAPCCFEIWRPMRVKMMIVAPGPTYHGSTEESSFGEKVNSS